MAGCFVVWESGRNNEASSTFYEEWDKPVASFQNPDDAKRFIEDLKSPAGFEEVTTDSDKQRGERCFEGVDRRFDGTPGEGIGLIITYSKQEVV